MDGLRPRPIRVHRFTRGDTILNICKVEYKSSEVAKRVIANGWVKFEDHVWLQAETPKPRSASKYCRTCKKCKLDCRNRGCKNLRCGRCGEPHKTSDCKQDDDKVSCLHCKSTSHLMFKCPKMNERFAAEEKRKKEAKTAKRKRYRERKKAKLQQAKANKDAKAAKSDAVEVKEQDKVTYASVVANRQSSSNQTTGTVSALGISEDEFQLILVQTYIEMLFPNHDEGFKKEFAVRTLQNVRSATSAGNVSNDEHVVEIDTTDTNMPIDDNDGMEGKEMLAEPVDTGMQLDALTMDTDTKVVEEVQSPTLTNAIKTRGKLLLTYFKGKKIPAKSSIICGCSIVLKPKGFGGHKKKCKKWTTSIVQL